MTSTAILATIELPWPSKDLSPNARKDRRGLTATRVKSKTDAYMACLEIGAKNVGWLAAHVDMEFCPPDNRARDLDNMLASNKAALDGVAKAIGVDDSQWSISLKRGPVVKHGKVVIRLSPVHPHNHEVVSDGQEPV
ncbi:hypothetical protein [Pelagibacterium luteolum]|uniref:Holliday junction resolvase RusA (Prophage-encoded endonuclease) n=1 Tax=Pelagibacterium luteolum TaxID=440168 RepID=A0A1G7TID6_9HYPH|nr:hypothetical protein [Pelagibacterium luteolum]SDG34971.1 hypothetical protein SAMN04487974_102143 [Pelagibacterium luteolum]